MSDINQNFFEEKYQQMTDENLLQEISKNKNNLALDCLIDRYKDIVGMKANKTYMNFCISKVKKIKNNDLTQSQYKKSLKESGGTNSKVLLYILGCAMAVSLIVAFMS